MSDVITAVFLELRSKNATFWTKDEIRGGNGGEKGQLGLGMGGGRQRFVAALGCRFHPGHSQGYETSAEAKWEMVFLACLPGNITEKQNYTKALTVPENFPGKREAHADLMEKSVEILQGKMLLLFLWWNHGLWHHWARRHLTGLMALLPISSFHLFLLIQSGVGARKCDTLALTCCVTLHKLLAHSVPRFPYMFKGSHASICWTLLSGTLQKYDFQDNVLTHS